MAPKRVFRILFSTQGKAYELYARQVAQGEIHGFVEVEDLLFGERSSIVVDPSEESLRNEFGGVRKLFIPFHAVNRIDEVDKEGTGKVIALASAGDQPLPPIQPFPAGKKPDKT